MLGATVSTLPFMQKNMVRIRIRVGQLQMTGKTHLITLDKQKVATSTALVQICFESKNQKYILKISTFGGLLYFTLYHSKQ